MPPRRRKPRAPRCAYREGDRQCGQPGEGNPPLCRAHLVAIQSEAERRARPGAGLADVIGSFVSGKPIDTHQIFDAVRELFAFGPQQPPQQPRGAGRVDRPPDFNPFQQWYEQQQQRQRQAADPQERPPPPGKSSSSDIMQARKVLGFQAFDVITADELRKRYRKLAFKLHPDRAGGSASKMSALNDARDILAADLG